MIYIMISPMSSMSSVTGIYVSLKALHSWTLGGTRKKKLLNSDLKLLLMDWSNGCR